MKYLLTLLEPSGDGKHYCMYRQSAYIQAPRPTVDTAHVGW